MDVYGGIPQQTARAQTTAALSNGIPIFVTEFGTSSVWPNATLEFDETVLWWAYLDQYFISRVNWDMTDIPGMTSAITWGTTSWDTPAAQLGAIVANSAYWTDTGIFVNQRHQNKGIFFPKSSIQILFLNQI